MEPNMKNNKRDNNEKYKNNKYQMKKGYDTELIDYNKNKYMNKNNNFYIEKKEISNGSKQDKHYTINKKPSFVIKSINQNVNEKINNNYEEYNEDKVYHTQLIKNRNHNYLITGKNGSQSKSKKNDNKSLTKKEPKKSLDMAKTLKIYSGIETRSINISNDNFSQKEKDTNRFLKNDNSSDKISVISGSNTNRYNHCKISNIKNIATNEKNTNNNNKIETYTNINKNMNNNLLLKMVKESHPAKIKLNQKFLKENPSPLRTNYKYNRQILNNNEKNINNNHKINEGDHNINILFIKDEKEKNNDISYKLSPNNKRKMNKKELSEKTNCISKNDNNNYHFLKKSNSNLQDIKKYYNEKEKEKEKDKNIKKINVNKSTNNLNINRSKNEMGYYSTNNFSGRKNTETKSYVNTLKENPNSNINNKTIKTPKSIKHYTNINSYITKISKSGRHLKIINNRSVENILISHPKVKDEKIHYKNETMPNTPFIMKNNSFNSNKKKVQKISIDLNNNKSIEIPKAKTNNNTNKKNIINNKNKQITNNNKTQLKQVSSQNNIRIKRRNNDGNIIQINHSKNAKNNGINNKNNNNKIIFVNNNNKKIFYKKINCSPPTFAKKPLSHEVVDNFVLSTNTNYITTNSNINIKNSNNLVSKENDNRLKTENNEYAYNKREKKNSIDYSLNANTIGSNGTIYKKQKPVKKTNATLQKEAAKRNTDLNFLAEKRYEYNNNNSDCDIFNIDINDDSNYQMDKINNKIIHLKHNKKIKYYDYYISRPKIDEKKFYFSRIYLKSIKIPKIEICNISKINSVIYLLYKNKQICYISKIRKIEKKIIKPPINDLCECSKNIILIQPNQNINNNKLNVKNIENKSPVTSVKKHKKRKKRRKTRRLHKGNENDNCNVDNNNNTEDGGENNDDENNENNKEKEGPDDYISKEEKEEKEEENDIDNINNNIKKVNSNNQNNINEEKKNTNKNNMTNDKSIIYKSSNEDKSAFSEKELIASDIGKNSIIRKKFSPTTYNDDECNNEENDDFRIVSDDDLSEDKFKKKENIKENKTEGKEILGDLSLSKNNKNEQKINLTDIEKKIKALELLEKIQGKRNSIKKEEINYNNNNNDNEIFDVNSNGIVNNYKNMNKNILLGTNKLTEIFNNQKMIKYNQTEKEEENDDDSNIGNYINYSDEDNININTKNNINNNLNEYIKKNNTFKKDLDYEKIGTIFDKLEGIFGKKTYISVEKSTDIDNEKCKTPLLNKESKMKSRINNLNLTENNYIDNESNNDIYNYNYNDEDYSEGKKSTNINKYKEILNSKQQIFSKLESLMMNKQKNQTKSKDADKDNFYIFKNYMFNSPKIESEIDSDMNINKDTPGNRKELKNSLYLRQKSLSNRQYTYEEMLQFRNRKICSRTNLLPFDVINHCNEILTTLQDNYSSSFKKNYKDIIINRNSCYSLSCYTKSEKDLSLSKWARKDMTKEIEEAEKYIKELNIQMSKDNYKYQIIEILNTLTVDNYKNIFNKIIEMVFLSENNKNNILELNKPEYLLHNQCILVEVILDKATIEKGYVVLYAKLCADLFIEYIKLIKHNTNPEIKNQLFDGENLKTILTSECRQRFDECISISSLSNNMDNEEKEDFFLNFKKKFLGNMNFIAELINVKILSQTKGFEFLNILYKRYKEIEKNDKIKYLNLEGAVTLLTKFGKIIVERQNPKHMQNLDNYMKDNIYPIISNDINENKNLPHYLKFKIINLIEKKKNNWKDSLYEQSIIAKGKDNNNINNSSIYNDGHDSHINIDESLNDAKKVINNNNNEEENHIINLLQKDIENYVSFLNEHDILNKKDLDEYNNKKENNDINNEYDWSISEELIIKTKNELEEIIRCYIEVCIDYVTKENIIFYCNEYIKNIINYYSVDLNKEEIEKVCLSMNDLYLNIEDICIDNNYMLEVMGYLMLILINNNLYHIEDLNKFIDEDKNKIIKISHVIKFALFYSGDKYKELFDNFEKLKLFEENKNIFDEYIKKSFKNDS